ncbi:MAG: choice-of-anchor D domain-containing protein [Planctomycetota bacterium]
MAGMVVSTRRRIHWRLLLEELEPRIAPAAGDLDLTFGIGGLVTTDFAGANDQGWDMAIQPDGKIIVAGHAITGGNRDFALARYNADGTLDATFGTGGKVTTNFPAAWDEARAIALQPDGKIVAGGDVVLGNRDFALVRYNADGSLDTTFGTGGKVSTDFGSGDDGIMALAVQSDGKIVAVGYGNDAGKFKPAVARYNSDGTLDTTFDGDGKVVTAIYGLGNDWGNAMALQEDGKIVVVGGAWSGAGDHFFVVRYNTDGSLDTSFSDDGKVITVPDTNAVARAVAIEPNGMIVVGGGASPGGPANFALARYNTDGSLDTTFGVNGIVTTDFAGGSDISYALAVQSDGKILLAGEASGYFALARYNTDGSLDTSFGGDGKITTAIGSNAYGRGLQIDANGMIVVAGYASTGTGEDFALSRYEGGAEITVTDSVGLPDDLAMGFGYTLADGAGGAAQTGTVTITNDGSADLNIASVSVLGSVGFSVSGFLGGTIAAGDSETVTVTFDPTSGGIKADTLRIESNDPDEGIVDLSLTGIGMTPLVLNKVNPKVRFYDLDGDYILLMYKGDGEAWVATTNGLSPLDDPNQDIGSIQIFGSTNRSMLMARDMNPKAGGNTLVLGTVETSGGESLGAIRFINRLGVVQNTDITIGGDLNFLQIVGAANSLNVNVTGDLTRFVNLGGVSNTSIGIGGNANRIMVTGDMDGATVNVAGTTGLFRVIGGIAGGSAVTLGGNVSKVLILAGLGAPSVEAGSTATFGADLAGRFFARGEVGGTVDVTGSSQMVRMQIVGDLSGTLLSGIFGDVTVIGNFTGAIGDGGTVAGVGNTLRVVGPTWTGAVTPANAFARYVWVA